MPVLFCNVGWMEQYQGLGGDTITGGGAHVAQHGRGHEMCNFYNHKQTHFGYVQPPGTQIDIERLGASSDQDELNGVTVFWTATRPTGGTTIVGWYENATVYREYQYHSSTPPQQKKNDIDGYWVKAATSSSVLLPIDARTFEIPRQVKGGMGQSNVWYADTPESKKLVQNALKLMSGAKLKPRKSGVPRNNDPLKKAAVEKAAIQTCCKHFVALGYHVESVEKENLGWDLEAINGKTKLRIEVKGLSGIVFSIELTPNEYKAFDLHRPDYRLAVVTNALESPQLYVCRHSSETDAWQVEGSTKMQLKITVRQSAAITCS